MREHVNRKKFAKVKKIAAWQVTSTQDGDYLQKEEVIEMEHLEVFGGGLQNWIS